MKYTVTIQPDIEPVTLQQAKDFLRVTSTSEDDLIEMMIGAARRIVESDTWRVLNTQTQELTLDRFQKTICIDKTPIQSITTIKYIDQDDVEQTMATANFSVDLKDAPARIRIDEFPSLADFNILNKVTITFVAGYGDKMEDIPETSKLAVLIKTRTLYDNRSENVLGTQVHSLDGMYNALVNDQTAVRF